MSHRLRSWFLRSVLEALQRQCGSFALASLQEKVPRRLLPHASLDRLRASAALDTILLDDGEELLLCIDNVLGEGNGRLLESLGQELAARALLQGGVAKFGDFVGTVARLQAFLDHPFVDTPTLFDLKRTDLGFTLTVGVSGRPRATRVLRHLAAGAILAAERAARDGVGIRLSAELLADRAALHVQHQRETVPVLESEPPPTSVRRPAHSMRPPSLSEEVERILASHKPLGRRITPAPGSYRHSQLSGEPTSEVKLAAERPLAPERTSEVQVAARPTRADDSREPASSSAERRFRKG